MPADRHQTGSFPRRREAAARAGPGWRAAGLTIALLAASAAAAPRVEAPEPVFAFGWRDAAETVTNRFILRNAGDETLLLTDIRVSCGCTRAEPERRALPPGASTALDVRLALRGLNGWQRKSVTVLSNDPATPSLVLWLEGEARAAVCLDPPAVSFGRVDPREPRDPVLVRLGGYATNLVIAAAQADSPAFPVAVAPGGRALIVEPPRLSAPGSHRAEVRVTLADPARPPLTLSLFAWVDDLLRVAPSSLTFGPGAAPSPPRLVVVRPGSVRRFTLTRAAVEGGSGSAAISARPDGSYQVKLAGVVPDSLAADAALVLYTDLPERPEWRVPLRREADPRRD